MCISSGLACGSTQDITLGRTQDVNIGLSLALHRGPYREVYRTSFGYIQTSFLERNFAEWRYCKKNST